MRCEMCPRKCGIDREKFPGFCGERDKIRIAKIIHNFMWEEPPVSKDKGTCAIFFSGCNLRCSYCQNYKISRGGIGKEYTIEEFANLLKEIDKTDDESIDLITPTHFVYYIIKALEIYTPKKPIVYNTSGYESVEMIEKIAPYISIFLPDFKYFDEELSKKYSKAPDYFNVALKAIKTMNKLKPNKFENGELVEGVIIRHMVLPGCAKDSVKILEAISKNINDPVISLMSQFTPSGEEKKGRKISNLEYKVVLAAAKRLNLTKGYFQDLTAADENFIPEF